ncbi:CBS domain-containing protein [Microlunatus lacustris]
MRIADILSTKGADVVHIGPDAPVRALVALLREHNLGAVVVSADGRTITGIVSERDVVRRLADGVDVLDQPVSALMSTDVHRGTPQDSVRSVMATMTGRRIRHVPVVDEQDRLVGIVSIGDVVKSQISELEFERDQLEDYVAGGSR